MRPLAECVLFNEGVSLLLGATSAEATSREHAITGGDEHVIALTHAEQKRVHIGRYHREAVGGG